MASTFLPSIDLKTFSESSDEDTKALSFIGSVFATFQPADPSGLAPKVPVSEYALPSIAKPRQVLAVPKSSHA